MHFANTRTTRKERTASGNAIWRLLPEDIGVPSFEMRYFEVPPGGATSYGKHPWEHEVFVITGGGLVTGKTLDGEPVERQVEAGDAIYIAPNEEHQFQNGGDSPFGFICVCPKGYE